MKNEKVKLNDFKVKSFTTSLEDPRKIYGGLPDNTAGRSVCHNTSCHET